MVTVKHGRTIVTLGRLDYHFEKLEGPPVRVSNNHTLEEHNPERFWRLLTEAERAAVLTKMKKLPS